MVTEQETVIEPSESVVSECSAVSRVLGEPLAGTAAAAPTWLCLEQPGPWGHDALLESRLDATVGAELAKRAADTGVRISLIRRPGRAPSSAADPPARQVYLAHTMPGSTWLKHAVVTDPAELLALDFDALAAGHPPIVGAPLERTVALVCTNGRRDQCCARLGRDVARQLAATYGEVVWETTHTGGHRFAPTGVTLPLGYLYGRLADDAGRQLVQGPARGEVVLDGCRGRSSWTPHGQVAELAVRERIAENRADVLMVGPARTDARGTDVGGTGVGGTSVGETDRVKRDPADHPAVGTAQVVQVRHADGRAWHVAVAEREQQPPRPTSCGADRKSPIALSVVEVEALDNPAGLR